MKSRLSTRLALATLHRFGHSPRTLLLAIYLLNAFHVVLHVRARRRRR
jgi:di/tricarboxylate transporter